MEAVELEFENALTKTRLAPLISKRESTANEAARRYLNMKFFRMLAF